MLQGGSERSALSIGCIRRENGGKLKMLRSSQPCWKASSFQDMGSGMGDMYKGSYVFASAREIDERKSILPAKGIEHSRKKEPLGSKYQVRMTELGGKNVLPWDELCNEDDHKMFCPTENIL